MEDRQTVIYVAASLEQAYMLRNLLAEQGIRAIVTNQVLDKGAGVDFIGWPALPRVVVDEADARVAREIAMRHDRQGAEMARQRRLGEGGEPAEAEVVVERWPRCPNCGQPRVTRCPICKTTGTQFPEADEQYVWGMGLDETAGEKASCGCGHGACGGGRSESEGEDREEMEPTAQAEADVADEETPERLVLVCPTCSEPFVPEFPRRCAWCGHEFDDGFEPEDIVEPILQLNRRAIAIVLGLVALLLAAVVYFMIVL